MMLSLDHDNRAVSCTQEELSDAVVQLSDFDKRGMVPEKDLAFVRSLVEQFFTKKYLSPVQAYYVFLKLQSAMGMTETKIITPISFRKVFSMFAKAKEKLQRPHVVFPDALHFNSGVESLKIYPAGKSLQVVIKDRYPGTVAWIGDDSSLNWKYTAKLTESEKQQVMTLLKSFAADPAGTVAKMGKLANKCCFCSKQLTDPSSVHVGYGPVCAENYGLHWG